MPPLCLVDGLAPRKFLGSRQHAYYLHNESVARRPGGGEGATLITAHCDSPTTHDPPKLGWIHRSELDLADDSCYACIGGQQKIVE
eukprot:SAG31_NODE_16178_length_720_cov_0.752013_2_plen_85_part_01